MHLMQSPASVMARMVLEDYGYHTTIAYGAAEALDVLAREERYDLLFSDVIMPGGINGRQLADTVLSRRPEMRIVLMSGYTDETDTGEAGGASDLPVLAKPFARQDLARALQRAKREGA